MCNLIKHAEDELAGIRLLPQFSVDSRSDAQPGGRLGSFLATNEKRARSPRYFTELIKYSRGFHFTADVSNAGRHGFSYRPCEIV